MSLHFASSIKWDNMQSQIALALTVASECFGEEGEDCYVTGLDRHVPGVVPGSPEDFAVNGFHSNGRAADLSVKRLRGGENIPDDKMDRIFAALNARLGRVGGSPFDVLDERHPRADSPSWTGPHIHIEFQPL